MTLLSLSIVLLLARAPSGQELFPWRADLAAATREAAEGGLPLLIVFR